MVQTIHSAGIPGGLGSAVSVAAGELAAGLPTAATAAASGAGLVWVYAAPDGAEGLWTEPPRAELTGPDGGTGGEAFGSAVLLFGDYLAVGAEGASGDSGALHIFKRSDVDDSVWEHKNILEAGTPVAGSLFGSAVALAEPASENKDRLVVGARGAGGQAGAVHTFQRRGNSQNFDWESEIAADDGQAGDEFGATLAASGNDLFVGAPLASAAGGAVYHFSWSGGVWSQQLKLVNSGERCCIIVAAMHGRTRALWPIAAMTDPAVLTPPRLRSLSPEGGASGDYFGSALSFANSVLAVGARGQSTAGGVASGVVHLYVEGVAGQWELLAGESIEPESPVDGAGFGASVALFGVSGSAVVGQLAGDGSLLRCAHIP